MGPNLLPLFFPHEITPEKGLQGSPRPKPDRALHQPGTERFIIPFLRVKIAAFALLPQNYSHENGRGAPSV